MRKEKTLKKTLLILVLFLVFFLTACTSSFGISIGYKKQEMYVGEELQFQANVDDLNGTVIWSSSDEEIATVSTDGLVTALKAGTTYIIAKTEVEGEESQVYLIVKEKSGGATEDKVQKSISITGNQTIALESNVNYAVSLTATITNKEKNDKVVWESSDVEIATVNSDGLVTGKKIGVVTITAYLENDPTVRDTLPIIVRTADGTKNYIENYIITKSYVVDGDFDLTALNSKVVNMVDEYADSIVGVSNYQYSTTIRGTKSSTLTLASTGSAVIYEKEVVAGGFKYTAFTNNHVIDEADQLKAYLGDLDKEVDATLVKTDADVDLAIITFVTERDYKVIELETVDNYEVGDFVVAVGCSNGFDYYGTVTFGIISYKNRLMDGEEAVFIQHDAAINPGNSGGALLNLEGKLIGINTLKIATTEVEGMGFAVSMKTIVEFMNAK